MVKLLPFALFYTKLILFCLIDQVNRVGEPIQCHNGTWTQIPRCVPARCKTMPTPPQNGMIVAPSLNHGASGLYHCKVVSIVFDAARIKSLLHLHSLPRLDFFCLPVTQTTSLKSCNSRNQKHTHYNSRMDTSLKETRRPLVCMETGLEPHLHVRKSTVPSLDTWTMEKWADLILYSNCHFLSYQILLVGNMGLYDYRPYVRKITNNRQIIFDCDKGWRLALGSAEGATCIGLFSDNLVELLLIHCSRRTLESARHSNMRARESSRNKMARVNCLQ